jgi:hypothetical protein
MTVRPRLQALDLLGAIEQELGRWYTDGVGTARLVAAGLCPIVAFEKQRLNMIGNLV